MSADTPPDLLGPGAALPVVDMSDTAHAPAVLRAACERYGFFYLANHGVPQTLIDEMLAQSRAFFSLPLEAKRSVLANELNRGYTPFEEEVLDPEHQTKGDTKEGYYIGREVGADSEEARKFPLHGPNQWPDEAALALQGWRDVMERYFTALRDLGLRTVQLLLRALGLPHTHLDASFSRPMAALRLLHYSAQVSDPGNGVFGAGAHSDYGMFTFLLTDETPGLQVFLEGRWVDVPPLSGAFIVNLGDMLQRWTNDAFRSTLHRVVNTQGKERYSAPFFYEPNFDTEVTCLPGFSSPENPPRHPPTTSGEYLLAKYRQTHKDFAGGKDEEATLPS